MVIMLENDVDLHDDRKLLEILKKLTMFASNSFHSLNVSNHWNTPSNDWHGMAKVKFPFDNCGGEHYSPDCLHPLDEAKIKKSKEEHAARRVGSGHGGGRGGGCGGRHHGYSKKWSNDKKYGDRNDYGNGVQKRGNDLMCYFRHMN